MGGTRRATLTTRANKDEVAKVDAAALIQGVPRGDIVRAGALREAQRILREASGAAPAPANV